MKETDLPAFPTFNLTSFSPGRHLGQKTTFQNLSEKESTDRSASLLPYRPSQSSVPLANSVAQKFAFAWQNFESLSVVGTIAARMQFEQIISEIAPLLMMMLTDDNQKIKNINVNSKI